MGLVGWLLLVVGIDVAMLNLYRTYLDREELARRPNLYFFTPLAVLIGAALLHGISSALFWTVAAYLAAFHFVRQQVGFVSLYRLREGLPTRSADALVERRAIYALTVFPLVWWHANLPRAFSWFLDGDFLLGMPRWVVPPIGLLCAAAVLRHTWCRVASRRWAPGRDLWVLTTGLVWNVGIVLTNSDAAFTMTNVVMHGIPYMALVAWACSRLWSHGGGPLRPRWFRPSGLGLFLIPLLLLALGEEALWDVLVWHDLGLFGTWSVPSGVAAVAVPVLALPQLTHYVLDAFIWRLGPKTPSFARPSSRLDRRLLARSPSSRRCPRLHRAPRRYRSHPHASARPRPRSERGSRGGAVRAPWDDRHPHPGRVAHARRPGRSIASPSSRCCSATRTWSLSRRGSGSAPSSSRSARRLRGR